MTGPLAAEIFPVETVRLRQLHALVVTAPDAMRAQLRRLKVPQLVVTAAAFRRSAELTTPTAATKLALKSIAMRYQHLTPDHLRDAMRALDGMGCEAVAATSSGTITAPASKA